MKKNRMHYMYSHPPSPWHQAPGDDARMGLKNPSERLKSMEEIEKTLEAQLDAVRFYIGHLKTNVHVRSPFAQRPVTRSQSSSNVRGSIGTAVNTAEASSPSISDDEAVPSETSSEADTSFVKDAKLIEGREAKSSSSYSFTQKLRPRGSRGKASTAKSKAKYEAKKEERTSKDRNQVPSPIISSVSFPKRGIHNCASVFKNGKENIDLNAVNGKSNNVSDENNVANKGCEKNYLRH